MDPAPVVTFVQVARGVGVERRREPASAGPFSDSGTYPYGSWLADLDGDGRLDYYAVNHNQSPHLSGLFLNDGTGGFGQNLFTVAVVPAPDAARWAYLNLSNEMSFVGDLTGDGRVDLSFIGWSGVGVVCVNQGHVTGADWSGPGFLCYGMAEPFAYGDVNGDGRIDILTAKPGLDPYDAYRANVSLYEWRLNDGSPDVETWPRTEDFLALRVLDPSSPWPPFLDLNGDTIPDKIFEIPLPPGSRGPYGTLGAGKQVFLGRSDGSYALQAASGLEAVQAPIVAIEDVDGDGCLDVGTDETGYRDNQDWYVQDKVAGRCNATFHHVLRTQLPYYPGFRRYSVDIDNSGLLSRVVIVHGAYGNNDGQPVGVTINRKLADGTYAVIPPAESGIDITNGGSEYYADNLSPGDWDDDGRLDLAGTGVSTLPGTDAGFALWTSRLSTLNGWIKISLPTVTGFFAGSATIEVFDAGFLGDAAHLVTPVRRLYTGRTWGSRVFQLGVGMRPAVDVRVVFPDGQQATRTGVLPGSRLAIVPSTGPDTQPPTAPSSLAATAGGTQVALTWAASTDNLGVTAYLVERCQGSGCTGFAQIGTTAATTYTDPGLPAGTSYSYRVRASDAAGNLSTYSSTVSATILLPDVQPPTAPSSLAATASGTQIALTWTASADDVGVTGYLVERCQGAGCTGFAQIGTTTSTTYTDAGLLASTTYSYRLRATDAAGNLSPYSSTVSATTAVPSVITFVQVAAATPQSPQSSVAVKYGAAQGAGDLNVVVVGWNDTTAAVTSVVDSSGNAYVLATGPASVPGRLTQSIYYAKNIVAAAAGANTVTVRFSTAAIYADVRILEYGGLDLSNPVDVTAGAAGTGTAADSGAATTTTANDLIFGAATTTTGASAGAGFTSRIVTTPDLDLAEDKVVSGTGSQRATASISPSGAWVMQMVAFRGASAGPDTQTPTAPANLAATPSGTQIALAWTASSDNVGVTSYLVERCQGAGCSGFAQIGTTAATTYTDPGLAVGTSYSYRVRASDAAGNLSPYSGVATGVTAAPTDVAFVQAAYATPQVQQASVAVPYASAQSAGNLNVVVVGWDDTTATVVSVVDSAGNTYVRAVGPTVLAGKLTQAIYYASNIVAAAPGANTVTVRFSIAARYPDVRILEYRGLAVASPVDVTAAATGRSRTAASGVATTTQANDLIFGAVTTTTRSGAGAGFTTRILTSPNQNLAEDRIAAAPGPYGATASISPSGYWVIQMVAFKAAGALGP